MKEARDAPVEEALRLTEIGEYLYNRSYSYGDGRTEPREYGIEWQWQQSKPDEFGEGALLAEATRWHNEMAQDGISTEASKLRSTVEALTAERDAMRKTADANFNMALGLANERDALLSRVERLTVAVKNAAYVASIYEDEELERDMNAALQENTDGN